MLLPCPTSGDRAGWALFQSPVSIEQKLSDVPRQGTGYHLPIKMTRVSQALSEREGSAGQILALALACLLFGFTSATLAQEDPTSPPALTTITNVEQFWTLRATAGEQEYPIRAQIEVNYYDPDWKIIWVGMENGGSYLSGGNRTLPFKSGHIVELDGVARPGKQENIWNRTKIKVLGATTNQPIALTGKLELPEDLN